MSLETDHRCCCKCDTAAIMWTLSLLSMAVGVSAVAPGTCAHSLSARHAHRHPQSTQCYMTQQQNKSMQLHAARRRIDRRSFLYSTDLRIGRDAYCDPIRIPRNNTPFLSRMPATSRRPIMAGDVAAVVSSCHPARPRSGGHLGRSHHQRNLAL